MGDEYVFQMMKNKRLDLHRGTFEKLVDLMRPMYVTKKPDASALNPTDQGALPSAPIYSILGELNG
jgi:hypothetical protein